MADSSGGGGCETPAAAASTTSELRARVFDEMLDAVLVADDDRRYVDANTAACRLLERSREEILSLRVDDVMPAGGDIEARWREFLSSGVQSGELVLSVGEKRITVDFRARAHVAPSRHVSVLRDVTERVQAAAEAQRVGAILDQMNGLSVEAHLRKTPMELLPGISADFIRTTARKVFETGAPAPDVEIVPDRPSATSRPTCSWIRTRGLRHAALESPHDDRAMKRRRDRDRPKDWTVALPGARTEHVYLW